MSSSSQMTQPTQVAPTADTSHPMVLAQVVQPSPTPASSAEQQIVKAENRASKQSKTRAAVSEQAWKLTASIVGASEEIKLLASIARASEEAQLLQAQPKQTWRQYSSSA